jgi:hypothetical protein
MVRTAGGDHAMTSGKGIQFSYVAKRTAEGDIAWLSALTTTGLYWKRSESLPDWFETRIEDIMFVYTRCADKTMRLYFPSGGLRKEGIETSWLETLGEITRS